MDVERGNNKFNKEFKERLAKEMLKFNGKIAGGGEGAEILSEATSEGKLS